MVADPTEALGVAMEEALNWRVSYIQGDSPRQGRGGGGDSDTRV